MKNKNKQRYYRIISFIVSLTLIIVSFPTLFISADENGVLPSEKVTEPDTSNSQNIIVPTPIPTPSPEDGNDGNNGDAETKGGVLPPDLEEPTYLEDGVYAIKNVGNPTMYFDTRGHTVYSGGYMQQSAYSALPTTSFARSALFKIKRVSGTQYIVRLMTNNCLTFDVSGSSVITKEIPSANSSVAVSDRIYISETSTSGVFTICPHGSTKYISTQTSQTSGLNILAVDYSSETSRAHWTFTKYTGVSRHYVGILQYPEELLVSETFTVKAYASSTTQNINAPIFSVLNTDLTSTTKAEINSSSGELTAKEAGNIYVRASCGETTTSDVLVHIFPNMEGNYFFKSAYTFKYVTAQSGIVQLLPEFQLWRAEHVGNGFYKILFQSNNLSLTSPSTINTDITYSTYNGSVYQQWKFIEQTDGTYKISTRFNSQYYLSAGASSSSNGFTDLVVRTNQGDAKDEWFLLRATSDSPKQINVEIMYDFGYSIRYSDAISRINLELIELQKKYLETFDVFVNCSPPNRFISYGDTCSTNPTQECTHLCTDDCQPYHSYECKNSCEDSEFNPTLTLGELHHKNTTNMVLRIPFPDTSETFKVAFLGHDHCDVGTLISSSHVKNSRNGIAYPSLGLCAIMNYENQVEETKTLIHEFGHLLGAPDHYAVGCLSTYALNQISPYTHSSLCIYGEARTQDIVLSNNLMCEGCQAYIMATIDNYDHS